MNNLFPIFALIATILFAITSIYGKYIFTKMGSSYHFFLVQLIITGILLFIGNLILIPDISSIYDLKNLFLLILSSFLAYVGFISLYRGFEVGNVSVGGVLLSSRVLITIPLALLIGEIYPSLVYVLIIIAVIGALMVSWTKNLPIKELLLLKSSGMYYFVLTLITWSLSNAVVRALNNAFHPLLFLFIRIIFFAIIALLSHSYLNPRLSPKTKFIKLNRPILLHTLMYSFILLSAQSLFIWALGESLLITETIGIFEGIFTFILAISISLIPYFRNYLNEPLDKLTLSVRSMGTVITTLTTVGVVLLTYESI